MVKRQRKNLWRKKQMQKKFLRPQRAAGKGTAWWWEPGKTAGQGQAEGRSFPSVRYGISMKPS